MCSRLATRRASSAFILVLLTSALFLSVSFVTSPAPASAANIGFNIESISLLPSAGPPGTWVTVTGTLNATVSTTACQFSTSNPNFFSDASSDRTCTASAKTFFGSFRVRPPEQISTTKQLPGLNYTISITVSAPTGYTFNSTGNTTFFIVTPRVGFSTNPSAGQPWPSYVVAMGTQTVYIHGWGYNATTLNCVFFNATDSTSLDTGNFTSQLCGVNAGELTGQFTLNAHTALLGTTQLIGARGIPLGENANGTLIITHPVTKAILTPSFGPPGTVVAVSGSGWNALDHHVTTNLSSPGLTTSFANLTCTASAGGITGACSFTVMSNARGGVHTILVVGSELDSASVDFVVTATLTVTPHSGPRGTIVSLSGSGYEQVGNCSSTLDSTPSGLINATLNRICLIDSNYFLTGNSTFRVANTALAGLYTVRLGNSTIVAQGFVSDTFTVNIPAITLSSDFGTKGQAITVTGTNFNAIDTSCVLQYGKGPAPTAWYPFASSSCAVTGVGSITGSFTVPDVGPASLVIRAIGLPINDNATATFSLNPVINLLPAAGRPGTTVLISGSNFNNNDTSCAIASDVTGLISNPLCTIAGGAMSGSFTVATGTNGTYTVTVTGTTGDVASASFDVPPPPNLLLSPSTGQVGTSVGVTGSHYVGTTCLITAAPPGLFTTEACSISGGALTGTFTVAPGASPTSYTVTVQTNAGALDSATSTFTVTPTTATTVTTAASFTLSASPTSLTVNPGGVGAVTVTVQSVGGFSSAVVLSAPTFPSGVSASFSLNPVTPPAGGNVNSVLSIAVANGAPASTSVITVVGAAGILSSTTAFTLIVPATTTTTSSTTTTTTRPCIIATATFGSEVSPAVQFLRGFRDNLVLKTRAGSAFMEVFNAWYYSFSPSVASFIAANDPIRAPIRATLYPLLGVLGITTLTYSLFSSSPEFAVVIAGLIASSLIGLVYLTLPALVGFNALARRRKIGITSIAKASLTLLAVALALLAVGELAGSFILLAVASSMIVLVCVVTVPSVAALAILRPSRE